MTPLVPIVFWAQRKDEVYMTVDVQDSKQVKVTFSNNDSAKAGHIILTCEANTQQYSLTLDFYSTIIPEQSKYSAIPRHIFIVLQKQDGMEEYWPYLVKDHKKESHIKVDWNKWIDEDEEEEQAGGGGGVNMEQYGSNFNFGGGGEDDEGYQEDSDDDDKEEMQEEDDMEEDIKRNKARVNDKLDQ